MKKYLYVFNYPPEDKELCALEFRTLFKESLRVNIIYQIKIIVLIKVFL